MCIRDREEGDWFNMNGNAKRCVQTCWGKRTAARLQAHAAFGVAVHIEPVALLLRVGEHQMCIRDRWVISPAARWASCISFRRSSVQKQ